MGKNDIYILYIYIKGRSWLYLRILILYSVFQPLGSQGPVDEIICTQRYKLINWFSEEIV